MENEIMTDIKRIMLPTLALVAAAGMATAQMSAELDTDADGMLSLPEIQAAMPEITEESFVTLDTSADGMLDADEIAAGVEAGLLPASDG